MVCFGKERTKQALITGLSFTACKGEKRRTPLSSAFPICIPEKKFAAFEAFSFWHSFRYKQLFFSPLFLSLFLYIFFLRLFRCSLLLGFCPVEESLSLLGYGTNLFDLLWNLNLSLLSVLGSVFSFILCLVSRKMKEKVGETIVGYR